MNGAWPDPRCPVSGPDGSAPPWLRLSEFHGGGRQWYCTLCDQWATGSHLQGRRHIRMLWYFDQSGQAAALTSSVAAEFSQERVTHLAVMEPLSETAGSCAADVGAVLHSCCLSVGAAPQNLVSGSGHAHQCRITTLAQIEPGVVEELLALALARLESEISW